MDKKKQRNVFVALGGLVIVFVLIFALGKGSNTFSVTFDTDGGSDVPSFTVSKDNTITKPETPVKEGFVFAYWEHDGEEFDFSQPITADISLKANWEPITFTITFDTNGGSNIDDQLIVFGENCRKPNDPTREGFVFLGWFSNDEEFDFSQNINDEKTLIAKWVKYDGEAKEPIITTETVKTTSVINFRTIQENDSTLEVGKTSVKQNGINGEQVITYTVTYSDGKETGRVEVSRLTTKLPVNRIVLIGTKKGDSKPVVSTKTETKTAVVTFKTVQENDSTLEVGKTIVKQDGKNGIQTITYTVTYTDGKETGRVEVSRKVTTAPVDKIVLVGTKEPIYTFSVGQPAEFLGSPQMVVTIYKDTVVVSARAIYVGDVLVGDNNNDKNLLLVDKSLVNQINRAQLTSGTFVNIQNGGR